MAFALMISLIRNVPSAFVSVQRHKWNYESFIGRQLDHLSIGLVGYGRLGKMMAKYCTAFGMRVILCDPYKLKGDYDFPLSHIMKQDVVSLHVHLNEDTRHMINDYSLEDAKDGMYLVNTSRGEVVDEEAVIRALESGKLAGYATDVISDELGNIENSKLIEASGNLNIIITPHIGGMTHEAQKIAYEAVAMNLIDWCKSHDRM